MSTDNPQPTGPAQEPTVVPPAQGEPASGTPSGEGWTPVGEEHESFFTRHSGLLISAGTAVIVAALAVVGVFLWKQNEDDANADTASAVTEFIEGQGGEVETIECDGDTCDAVVGGQAYTVLVQEDEDGDQHFGVTSFTGD
ncbi:hypothetical protein [Blastococcus sp. TF02A-30]|uniref:hypothetical protein n=1 Tax=Blastococcus sp. TF02A-30 TaxID=2250580 RepID=UPI000DE9CDC9|nr:hypothetical protein [Blastococcus sp. TF02A-30]RBY91035.1 hypothetical protein DQ241_04980 [Blastococcus sp. TF02A-30]